MSKMDEHFMFRILNTSLTIVCACAGTGVPERTVYAMGGGNLLCAWVSNGALERIFLRPIPRIPGAFEWPPRRVVSREPKANSSSTQGSPYTWTDRQLETEIGLEEWKKGESNRNALKVNNQMRAEDKPEKMCALKKKQGQNFPSETPIGVTNPAKKLNKLTGYVKRVWSCPRGGNNKINEKTPKTFSYKNTTL